MQQQMQALQERVQASLSARVEKLEQQNAQLTQLVQQFAAKSAEQTYGSYHASPSQTWSQSNGFPNDSYMKYEAFVVVSQAD